MKAAAVGGRLLKALFQSPLERERDFYRRYRELSTQIEERPDSVTIQTLRGELNLERGEYERAKADFIAAIDQAAALDESKGWLVVEQVMRDRALYGLKLAERKLRQTR